MITFRAFDLQHATLRPPHAPWWFDIVEGIPGYEPPKVRGEDTIAPGRDGRYFGNRRNDISSMVIEGYIRGIGGDAEARRLDWRSNTLAVMANFQMDATEGTLTVTGDSPEGAYLGFEPGESASIQARVVSVMPGRITTMSHQLWSVELFSITPEWTIDAGS